MSRERWFRASAVLCGGVLAVMVTGLAGMSSAQPQPSKIDDVFSAFHSGDPGCAVLVVKDGKVVYEKGYGVADLRTRRAIGSETNFRLASLTKQFTAMSIMLLVHDGKLRYEDSLTSIFPEFPAYGRAITIRMLLNHTSGLLDYEDIMDRQYAGVAPEKVPQIKDAEVLTLLKKQSTTKFEPGTRWDYSNSGYVVLAMTVEKVSGQRFGDFLRTRIFEPLGMKNSVAYEQGKNEVSNRAYGHTKTADGWRETDQSSTSATLGDGGIYTSLNDLAKWDAGLTAHTLLSADDMKPALTPPATHGAVLQTRDGKPAANYGFGWFLDTHKGTRRVAHYGETIGFRTAIQRYPDARLTVIVLSNRAEVDAPALAEKVADLFLQH